MMTSQRPVPEVLEGTNAAHAPKVVLVVDDQAVLRTILRHALTQRGYQVLTAVNGLDAVRTMVAYAGRIDVLITDLMMPMMSGEELLDYAAVLRSETKAICLSAAASEVSLRRAVLTLPKPFSLDAVVASVTAVLATAVPVPAGKSECLGGSARVQVAVA